MPYRPHHPLDLFELRPEQSQALLQPQRRQMEHVAARYLGERGFAQIGERPERLSEAIEEAARLGLTRQPELLAYLHLRCLLGPAWFHEPLSPSLRRLLRDPLWPASAKLELLILFAQERLQRASRHDEARALPGILSKALARPDAPALAIITPLPTAGPPPAQPLRLVIIQGAEQGYAVTPGVQRPLLEFQAMATPVGGQFRWRVDCDQVGTLTCRAERAWFRPRRPGAARVSVTYYLGDRHTSALTQIHIRPAARLRISPNPIDFGQVALHQTSLPIRLTLTNIGGTPLRLGRLVAPSGFALSRDQASDTLLAPDESATCDLICRPEEVGTLRHTWIPQAQLDYPDESKLTLLVDVIYPPAELAFLHQAETDHLTLGTWEHAFSSRDNQLHNGERSHFIDRDPHHFRIRVNDPEAASLGRTRVHVHWWTARDRDREADAMPTSTALSLWRRGQTSDYVSPPLLLVSDSDDLRQPTHDGRSNGQLAACGQSEHRLRLLQVDARDRLDRHVVARYETPSAKPLECRLPVFARMPDARRQVGITLVNLRHVPGGKPIACEAALTALTDSLRSVYARVGIFADVRQQTIDPPSDCLDWPRALSEGRDASVAWALSFREGASDRLVPSLSQLQILDAIDPDPERINLILVDSLVDPLSGAHIEGEAFLDANTQVPEDLAAVCAALNAQQSSRELARWLCPEARQFALRPWNPARRARLARLMREVATATRASERQDRAQAFESALARLVEEPGQPRYLAAALAQAQEERGAMFYRPATLAAFLEAARGCAFLAHPNRVSPLLAAHLVARILADAVPASDNGRRPKSRQTDPHSLRWPPRLDAQIDPIHQPKRISDAEGQQLRANTRYCKPYPERSDCDV